MIQKLDEEAENGCWMTTLGGCQVRKPGYSFAVTSLTVPFLKDAS